MTKGYQSDLFFTSPKSLSISSQFPRMQLFASLQYCLLFVAFHSTHQILLWHFQELLSVLAWLLTFSVSRISQSFSLSPGTFLISLFLFLLLIHQPVQQYQLLSPFVFSCQLKICLVLWSSLSKFYPYQIFLEFLWKTVDAFSFHASFV